MKSEAMAWAIMQKVVIPRCEQLNLPEIVTIKSDIDWEYGVALSTLKGTIHVLGTGEIIDSNNILNY